MADEGKGGAASEAERASATGVWEDSGSMSELGVSMFVTGSLEGTSPFVCRGVCDLSICVISSGTGELPRKTTISGTFLGVAKRSKASFVARVRQSVEAPAHKNKGAGARRFNPSALGSTAG